MSAVNSNAGDREIDALRRAQRAHEPSMEEILASIRTIIAEEREPEKAVAPKPAPRQPPAPAAGRQIVYSKEDPPPSARRSRRRNARTRRRRPRPVRRRWSGVSRSLPSPIRPIAPSPATRSPCCRPRPIRRSLRPSTPFRPVSLRAARNSPREWRAKCCVPCSRRGSTKTCPPSSNGLCAPKSSESRADRGRRIFSVLCVDLRRRDGLKAVAAFRPRPSRLGALGTPAFNRHQPPPRGGARTGIP